MVDTPDTAAADRARPRGGLGRFSPPDWAFLPGAAVVFAGLVMLALSYDPVGEDPVVTETEFVMAGPALAQLVPGPGTGFQLMTTGAAPVARATATASFEAAGRLSAGLAAVIPPAFEARVIGRLIKLEATVRAAPDSGITEARMAYFTASKGASGWRPIAVSEAFETVGFCFSVPAAAEPNGAEYFGLWPDIRGANRGLLIQEIRVTIQPEGAREGECEAGLRG
ncbi:MAG: hypothetical protein ACLFQ5_11180 [Oceanicaulis sp.]